MLQFKSDSNSLELEKTLRLGARFPKRLPHLRHQPPVGPHFCPLTTGHEPLRSDDLLTQHTELRKALYLAITDLSRGIWRNSQRKSAIEQCGRVPSNGSSVP